MSTVMLEEYDGMTAACKVHLLIEDDIMAGTLWSQDTRTAIRELIFEKSSILDLSINDDDIRNSTDVILAVLSVFTTDFEIDTVVVDSNSKFTIDCIARKGVISLLYHLIISKENEEELMKKLIPEKNWDWKIASTSLQEILTFYDVVKNILDLVIIQESYKVIEGIH